MPATPTTIDLGVTADGLPVVATDVELRGVGGGLTPALRIDPALFGQGDTVIISFEAVIKSIRFDPVDKAEMGGDQARVHIAVAEVALVRKAEGKGQLEKDLARVREKIAREAEKDQGIQRLPTSDELVSAHAAGEHATGRVDGCSECDFEVDLDAAGK